MPDSYIPRKIACLHCHKVLDARNIHRSYTRHGSREVRKLIIKCHGSELEIPFSATPDQEVGLWSEPAT